MARVPPLIGSNRPRQGWFHNFIPIYVLGLPWRFDWCWDFDHKLTSAPTTDADTVSQVSGRWGSTHMRKGLNPIDLDKSTEERFGLIPLRPIENYLSQATHHQYTSLMIMGQSELWASSGPLWSLLIYHPFVMCTPFLSVWNSYWAQTQPKVFFFTPHQFLELLVVPKNSSGLFLQPNNLLPFAPPLPCHTSWSNYFLFYFLN